MPLSDHEQRLLEQIERALYAEDPKFASTVRSTDLRHYHRRRVIRAALVIVLGAAGIAAGFLVPYRIAVYAGAAVAVIGIALTVVAWRQLVRGEPRRRTAATGPHPSFRSRMEQRWQRRWDERNF